MADLNKPGAQGGLGRRLLMELADRAFLGNRGYNFRYGTWDPAGTRQGAIGAGIGAVVPGGGTLYHLLTDGFRNFRMDNTRNWSGPTNFAKPTFGQPSSGPSTITQTPLDPAAPIPFRLPERSGPLRWDGSQVVQPNMVTAARPNLAIPNMGGARGMRSWGGQGITGEAATAMMEGIHMAPQSIYTGVRGQGLL
jgi:hypothetical protein